MKLTENFTLEEMVFSSTANSKGIDNTPSNESMINLRKLCEDILQPVRNRYGRPIRITSGYRSEALNRAVGGVATSQHKKGEAADIVCEDNRALWNVITEMMEKGEIVTGQLIDEKNLRWIHISLPNGKHRNQILRL